MIGQAAVSATNILTHFGVRGMKLCCNKVKRFPWTAGPMNHGGGRWGEEEGRREEWGVP